MTSSANSTNSLMEKIKGESIEPLQSLTTHGLPSLVRSKYASIKLMWLIIFLTALCVSVYFLYNTLVEYFNYDVKTQTRIMSVNEIDFPYVTLCSRNQFTTERSFEFLRDFLNKTGRLEEETFQRNESIKYDYSYEQSFEDSQFFQFYESYWPYEYYYTLPILQRKNITKDLNENGGSVEFKWLHNPFYGNCYQTKRPAGKANRQKKNTSYEVFSFDMSLPEGLTNLQMISGFFLVLHDKDFNPFEQFSNVIELETDLKTNIEIKKTVIQKYPKPYSDCDFVDLEQFPDNGEFNRKYYNQIKEADYTYSQSLCIEFCKLDQLKNNCLLRVSSIRAPYNDFFCPNGSYLSYETNLTVNDLWLESFGNEQLEMSCSKKCPLECTKTRYDYFINTTPLASDRKNTYIQFKIFYNSFEYSKYVEEPSISIYGLISNIGGVIGLFLGMSLQSLFEFVEIGLQSVIIAFKHKLNKNKIEEIR